MTKDPVPPPLAGSGRCPGQGLEAEREAALAQIEALTREFDSVVDASRSSNADDEHDPEGATIAWERQQAAASRDRLQARLAAVDAALDRVAAGSYGRCVTCGQPIAEERLSARPDVATCVRCAR